MFIFCHQLWKSTMSLEDDIVQSNFESVHHKGLVNIIYTHNHITGGLNDILKPHEITRQQFNVLRILRGQYPKPSNINLIKERMLDKMSDASRIVERLRVKGLVVRVKCPDDRRAVEVTISDEGLKLLKQTDSQSDQFKALLIKLTEEEATILNQLLDKIRSR